MWLISKLVETEYYDDRKMKINELFLITSSIRWPLICRSNYWCVYWCVCVFWVWGGGEWVRMCVGVCICAGVCVLAVYNTAPIISNREFKLWTFLQGSESRGATFLAETCVMSHQSLSRQAKSKYESPTAVGFGCKTLKSDHAVVRMFSLII